MESFNIRAITWNVAAFDIPENFSFKKLLETNDTGQDICDMYIVGFQEVSARADKYFLDSFISGDDPWTMTVSKELRPDGYIKVKSIRLLGIVLSVFCHEKHLVFLRNMETQYTRLSVGGYVGLKGAVSVRLEIYGVSLCFVCSHLSAHDHMLESRIQEYNTIIDSHTYKSEMTKNILYHDYIFWMGDLNFRLQQETLSHNEIVKEIENKNLKSLLKIDQLKSVQHENSAFHELSETEIDFAPTFKHVIGSDNYDTKRRPAWTDRILYRVNTYNLEDIGIRLSLSAKNYTSHTDVRYRCSDHRPVSSNIAVDVIGKELADNKDIEGWSPVIVFFPTKEDNVPKDWYVNRDGKITYQIDPQSSGSRLLHPWDWIGLYHEDYTSIDDYTTFTWASACRRSRELKYATIHDSALYAPGRFVLIYVSAKSSILGISKPFNVSHIPSEAALSSPTQSGPTSTKEKES